VGLKPQPGDDFLCLIVSLHSEMMRAPMAAARQKKDLGFAMMLMGSY
jgi:hypothetical protein